jgi:hypothetical protein
MAPTSSGSAWSERAVKPTRSQNNTVTTLRSSSAGRGVAASGAPHAPQNRKPWGLSCPHLEQLAIPAVYGEAPEPRARHARGPASGVECQVFCRTSPRSTSITVVRSQARISAEQPVTAQPPIAPDRPDDLVVDHPLDREPGQRTNLEALAASAPDPLAGPLQLGTMADRAGGGHRFLVAPQPHLLAGQGHRVGQGRGPVDGLGTLPDLLGHRHHQPSSSSRT